MNLLIPSLKRIKLQLVLVFSIAIFAMACHLLRKTSNANQVAFQGIIGKVIIKQGNFNSDGSIAEEGKVYTEKRMVYVYELTNLASTMCNGHLVTSIFTTLIATMQTDDLGKFKLQLPEGKYSFFVETNQQWYAELKPFANDFYFYPADVFPNKATTIELEIRE